MSAEPRTDAVPARLSAALHVARGDVDAPLRILHGDNLELLPTLAPASARLIYVDPPFNTRRSRRRETVRTIPDDDGPRVGFRGRRYRDAREGERAFADSHPDYLGFLMPRLEAGVRCLTDDGSLFVHLDVREVHHVKVALDAMLGRDRFMNEIIWAYDFGGRSTRRWPAKHDSILWYAMDPDRAVFRRDRIDRIPYMAPELVSEEKAARGKIPTDVWWQSIVATGGRERTGYPTQKPLGVVGRIVRVHADPGDTVLDFFAGSGTTGEAALRHGCRAILIDDQAEACRVMHRRLDALAGGHGPPGDRSSGE